MAAEPLAEAAIEATKRAVDARAVSFFTGGAVFGMALGFVLGYRFNREKIRAEALAEAEKEIEAIRDLYQQKATAAKAESKPSVSEIIEKRGYSTRVTEEELPARPLRPPVPVAEPKPVPVVVTEPVPVIVEEEVKHWAPPETEGTKNKNEGWSFARELARRSAKVPYVLHQDEFEGNESGYSQTEYFYYVADDTLVDTDNNVIENRENLIGHQALSLFGHGSDDFNTVYIRNSELELEVAIHRASGSHNLDDDFPS